MTLKYTKGGIIRGSTAERSTVPTDIPINTLYLDVDLNLLYRYAGSNTWDQIGATGTTGETFTNKTITVDENIIADSITNDAGDILVNDGTQFLRKARGAADTIPQMNTGGDDIEFAKVNNANVDAAAAIAYSKLALTNSIVDGDIVSVTSKAKLPSTLAYEDETNNFITGQKILNPAGTFSYILTASAIIASRTCTLPLLTTNDTFVFQDFTQTLTNKTINADSNTITNIENADIKAAAAIAYSKLNLATSIVDADIAAGAAIAKTKLAALAIVNADIDAAAAIAYSKLALTGAILNADLAGSIAYSKLSLTGAILNADLAGGITAAKLVAKEGSSTQSGDGTDTTFDIAHGFGSNPTVVFAQPGSNDAIGSYWLTKDATNITVNYVVAPPSGSSNLQWYWRAA